MKTKVALIAVLAIITCCLGISGAAAAGIPAGYYHLDDIGTLQGTASWATGLNKNGVVVGASEYPANTWFTHPILWTKRSGLLDLGTLSSLGGAWSDFIQGQAWGINNNSVVVGESFNLDYWHALPTGKDHACMWQPNKGITDLGTLGGDQSTAFAINDQGTVVGFSNLASDPGLFHACYWQNGRIHDLTPRSGKQSMAWALDKQNRIAGQIEGDTPGIFHGFFWTLSKGLRILPDLPGGSNSMAFGMSTNLICGCGDPPGSTNAVVWDINNNFTPTNLGNLGGTYCFGYNVNSANQVVGISETTTPGVAHGFTWTKSGGMQDLNDLVANLPAGAVIINATAITDPDSTANSGNYGDKDGDCDHGRDCGEDRDGHKDCGDGGDRDRDGNRCGDRDDDGSRCGSSSSGAKITGQFIAADGYVHGYLLTPAKASGSNCGDKDKDRDKDPDRDCGDRGTKPGGDRSH
jgi:probable HAF family extracellular repeat protein